MRNNLVTVLHCAECGKHLELAHEGDKPAKQDCSTLEMEPRMPTGSEMLASRISVKPCRHCMERITGPAVRLKNALDELKAVSA